MEFRVWAPKADEVELLLTNHRLAMEREPRGWWSVRAPEAQPGDRYAYSLDGGPSRPDPRSQDQPDGVHGWSRVVDHEAYRWRIANYRPRPLASGIIYELHLGTFTDKGTLDAAIERLDTLVDLGITHVELMPLNSFDGEHGWGYDGVAWFAPHRAYTGADGPDAVKRFVDACHERDLAVILDVVYNHLGPSGNYLNEFGDYFNDAYTTAWGPSVNLDGPGSDETRRLIIDNALMWLGDYRFDGLRIDAVHAFVDRSATHLLEQLHDEVRLFEASKGRCVTLIAESDLNDPRIVRSTEAGGYGMDAQWSDDFHHALHALFTGERIGYYRDFGSVADLAKALRGAFVYDGRYSEHRGRSHGRPATGLHSSRFLGYSQTHDQVGNRALGERLCHLADPAALEVIAALVLLSPFVPMLFQGEEWGASTPFQYFTDHQDEKLAEAVRRGRREEFREFVGGSEAVPDPQDVRTFERSKLRWEVREEDDHSRLLEWHKQLIALRQSTSDFTPRMLGEGNVCFSETERWIRFDRGDARIFFNLGRIPVSIPIGEWVGEPRVLLSNQESVELSSDTVRLNTYGCCILGGS